MITDAVLLSGTAAIMVLMVDMRDNVVIVHVVGDNFVVMDNRVHDDWGLVHNHRWFVYNNW